MIENKRWPEVRREAQRQGWSVTATTKGFALLAPDGATIVVMDRLHASSDAHALERTVRRMHRAGFAWPPPGKGR